MDPKAIEGNHFGEHKILKYHPADFSVFNHGFILHILELCASRLNNYTVGSTIFVFIPIAVSIIFLLMEQESWICPVFVRYH